MAKKLDTTSAWLQRYVLRYGSLYIDPLDERGVGHGGRPRGPRTKKDGTVPVRGRRTEAGIEGPTRPGRTPTAYFAPPVEPPKESREQELQPPRCM